MELFATNYRRPESIGTFFTEEYVVPRNQSKYRWQDNVLERMWGDITKFHDEGAQDDLYYFGKIYLRSTAKHGVWQVRDGGHRTRVWPIFLKALYDSDPSNKGLEYLLYRKDVVKRAPSLPKMPIVSVAIPEESAAYQEVLLNEGGVIPENSSKSHQSYHCFRRLISERAQSKKDPAADLAALTNTLLTRVVMLRAKSATRYHSATLIDTSNDQCLQTFARQITKSGFGAYASSQANEVVTISTDSTKYKFYIRLVIMIGKPKSFLSSMRDGGARSIAKRIRKLKKLFR